ASIEAIYEGHQYYCNYGFVPFAIDSGGWDYNISIKEESLGQIWVNKFDSGEENTMHYVAPSFEYFINNLGEERN
ncbi:MAG: cell wall assembly/cell proliferation coordinating protein, KNR4-like protein, partial [bacterium]|nr:cell wall assembly/cell proliferation coordinating protein, KNR4-like protein [bacterium]